MDMKIGIIGCGHMGGALAGAIIKKYKATVWASNPTKPHFAISNEEKKLFKWTVDNSEVVKNVDIIFLAVKPAVMSQVLLNMKSLLKPNQIIISIAAGIPLHNLKKWSGAHKKIIRVMPNLPLLAMEGMCVWQAAKGLTKDEKNTIKNLLASFGKEIEVKKESLIDVATAVSGGGPAHTAAFLQCLFASAKNMGFSKDHARLLALQTVLGSLKYITETDADFETLKTQVQTKGGTTEAAYKILNRKRWQQTFESALLAAYKRAREISEKS